MLTTVFTAA